MTMETAIKHLFESYERSFAEALAGAVDMDEATSLYAGEFIAASPLGIVTGKNDEQFKSVLAGGYEHYRAIGTKKMRIRDIRISPIDEHHCIAHVVWAGTYSRRNPADVTIDFDVHYLVQKLAAEAKVFGWVTSDEQALLREHGIV